MDKTEAALLLREALGALGDDAKNIISEAVGAQAAKQDQRVHASEPVPIYALQDVPGPDGKIVHPRGSMQEVPPVDAREIVRGGLYGYSHPGPVRGAFEGAGTAAVMPPAKAAGQTEAIKAPGPTPFALTSLPNVNAKLARVLEDAKAEDGQSLNLGTLEGFRAVKPETLASLPGVGAKLADILKSYVAETYKEE